MTRAPSRLIKRIAVCSLILSDKVSELVVLGDYRHLVCSRYSRQIMIELKEYIVIVYSTVKLRNVKLEMRKKSCYIKCRYMLSV